MRTNKERISALHKRTRQLKKEQDARRFAVISAGCAAVCIGILLGMAILIPHVSQNGFTDDSPAAMNASIFSGSSVSGYLAIAVLAFLLGITVTVFCFRLKRHLDENDKEEFR